MEQTIAAAATAPGEGGIGIVRVSGPEAEDVLRRVFRFKSGKLPEKFEERRMIYGNILGSDGKIIDEAMVVLMKAPHTYTGEDVAEIQCHGSAISIRKILETVLQSGARLAERGEFTQRAFLNGRIDLSQAEAVIDVIRAKSEDGYRSAVSQMGGSLSAEIETLRTNLADLISNIIAHIEYPDEDFEELTYSYIISQIDDIYDKIKELADTADTGRIVRDGLKLSIVGKPNVGKSSLMNALLKSDRAIVTDIPGTTRDTIEEFASIAGIPVYLVDTAGIRKTEDTIEKIGIEKSLESIESADVVIFVIDGSVGLTAEDRNIMQNLADKKVIFVINKTDLSRCVTPQLLKEAFLNEISKAEKASDKSTVGGMNKNIVNRNYTILQMSALTGEGIESLSAEIRRIVYHGETSMENEILITNVRHASLLQDAMKSLSDAKEMLIAGEALDFAETDIRAAWNQMGEIIGETVNQDILTEVFSRFCLGK